MVGDWIRLHRKVIDSQVFSDPKVLAVWIWCLCRANYKARVWQGQRIEAGEFITGKLSGAQELRMAPTSFYRYLKKLESWGQITLKVDRKWTTVSICNWGTYQQSAKESGPQVDRERTASGPQVDTDNKDKNLINEELEDTYCPPDEVELFRQFWNGLPGVRECRTISDKRRTTIKRRLRETLCDKPWFDLFKREGAKHFPLMCFIGGTWTPNIDFAIKPYTLLKIIEGHYDWRKDNGTHKTAAVGPGQVFHPDGGTPGSDIGSMY